MNFKGLDEKLRLLLELRSIAAEIRSEISSIENSLKAAMLIRKTNILTGEDSEVILKASMTTRFDAKDFKLAHADLYERYSKSVTTRRLVISKKT